MLLSQRDLLLFHVSKCGSSWKALAGLDAFSVHHHPIAHAIPASLRKHEYEWIIEIPRRCCAFAFKL